MLQAHSSSSLQHRRGPLRSRTSPCSPGTPHTADLHKQPCWILHTAVDEALKKAQPMDIPQQEQHRWSSSLWRAACGGVGGLEEPPPMGTFVEQCLCVCVDTMVQSRVGALLRELQLVGSLSGIRSGRMTSRGKDPRGPKGRERP